MYFAVISRYPCVSVHLELRVMHVNIYVDTRMYAYMLGYKDSREDRLVAITGDL